MRWDGQEIGSDGVGDAVALPGLRGLLRSVSSPEFAGVVFHEVEARSALNKVPGESAMPFGWTINPYRGCTHACTYCLSADTPILLADGRTRPIAELCAGHAVYGTERDGHDRRYTVTRVLARWPTTKLGYRITLGDGTELVASAEHRFLSERGWAFTTAGGRRRALRPGDRLLGAGRAGAAVEPGKLVEADERLQITSVAATGVELPMVDITTGTGDFIANGVVSHNCFARNSHTYLDLDAGADFDSQIVVKVNVARVLERELRSPRWNREPVALGTNTDPYQRAEGRYRLMPGIISALASSGTPLSVLTKGTLLTRDLPQLVAAAADVPVSIGVSLALVDRELHRSVEPGAPAPPARLELVRRVREAGLPCGVMVAPVLPLLTDSVEALDALLAEVAAAGASGATVLALHLRRGTREWYLQWLAAEHPELLPAYERLYRRGAYVDPEYRRELAARVAPLLRQHGLARGAGARTGSAGPRPNTPASDQLSLL